MATESEMLIEAICDIAELKKRVSELEMRTSRSAPPVSDPAPETPQPLREAPPSGLHGSMADVLGFPKEGR